MRREPENFNLVLEARSEVLTCLNFYILKIFQVQTAGYRDQTLPVGLQVKHYTTLRHQFSFRLIITNLVGPGHPHVPAISIFQQSFVSPSLCRWKPWETRIEALLVAGGSTHGSCVELRADLGLTQAECLG